MGVDGTKRNYRRHAAIKLVFLQVSVLARGHSEKLMKSMDLFLEICLFPQESAYDFSVL